MTEKNIFRTALITLGSTIVAPLIVGATGLGLTGDLSTNDRVKTYIASAHAQDNVAQSENKDNLLQTSADNSTATQSTPSKDEGQKDTPALVPVAVGAKAAGTYTVKAGDTYGCIAENHYGSYEQWPKVYAANSMYPGYEEYRLHVGAVVQLPAITVDEVRPVTDLCK
ncbi:hypothetical protein KA093_01255 [Candidatus Saccharibacteria bacterium]|nr:hypothetical protein [Candidatus Saccharibacteria bacterium]